MRVAPGAVKHDKGLVWMDRDNALAGVEQAKVGRHLEPELQSWMQETLSANQSLLGIITKQHAVDAVEENVAAAMAR